MICRHVKSFIGANDMAYDSYRVDDGSEIYEVIVGAAGDISISHERPEIDAETFQAITAAVLEAEEKRGF